MDRTTRGKMSHSIIAAIAESSSCLLLFAVCLGLHACKLCPRVMAHSNKYLQRPTLPVPCLSRCECMSFSPLLLCMRCKYQLHPPVSDCRNSIPAFSCVPLFLDTTSDLEDLPPRTAGPARPHVQTADFVSTYLSQCECVSFSPFLLSSSSLLPACHRSLPQFPPYVWLPISFSPSVGHVLWLTSSCMFSASNRTSTSPNGRAIPPLLPRMFPASNCTSGSPNNWPNHRLCFLCDACLSSPGPQFAPPPLSIAAPMTTCISSPRPADCPVFLTIACPLSCTSIFIALASRTTSPQAVLLKLQLDSAQRPRPYLSPASSWPTAPLLCRRLSLMTSDRCCASHDTHACEHRSFVVAFPSAPRFLAVASL